MFSLVITFVSAVSSGSKCRAILDFLVVRLMHPNWQVAIVIDAYIPARGRKKHRDELSQPIDCSEDSDEEQHP